MARLAVTRSDDRDGSATHRIAAAMDQHSSFNLETHEKHRQQKIRLEETKRTVSRSQQSGVKTQEPAESAQIIDFFYSIFLMLLAIVTYAQVMTVTSPKSGGATPAMG
jgi:hypothetical protein